MRRTVWYVLGVAIGAPAALGAQGFGVYEHGTCTMGRAGAAVARPCADGSATFFNPAGLAGMQGTHLAAGVTLIPAAGSFTDDFTRQTWDLENPVVPVPNFYISHGFSDKLGASLGVFVPYGLETKWPTGDFPGRFLGWNSRLRAIYIQPTVGYQLHPRLKVGLGAAYVVSDIELKQRVDLSEQVVPSPSLPPGTTFSALGIPTGSDFAEGQLQAEGNGLTFNIGAIVKVSERFSIGARYLSRTTIEYDGDAVFTQLPTTLTLAPNNPLTGTTTPVDALVAANFAPGGPLGDGGVGTSIVMPPQAVIGIAWQASDRWAVMADYQTVIWGWFASLPVDFDNPGTPDFALYEGYNDTHGVRFGVEHQYNSTLVLRGGYLYHTAAAPAQTVTPLLPEGSRNEFTLGLGWAVNPKLKVDLGYQYIRQQDRRGRVYDETVGNTGLYTFKGNLFGLGLSYTF